MDAPIPTEAKGEYTGLEKKLMRQIQLLRIDAKSSGNEAKYYHEHIVWINSEINKAVDPENKEFPTDPVAILTQIKAANFKLQMEACGGILAYR